MNTFSIDTLSAARRQGRGWRHGPGAMLAELRAREPVLTATGLAILAAAVPLLLAREIDGRTLAGVDAWSKPLKFHLSVGLYALTLAWYAGWTSARDRASAAYRGFRSVVVVAMSFELVVIDWAVAAGTTSHFNVDAPLFPGAYPLMGVGAVVLTSMSGVQGVLVARHRDSGLDPARRLSLVLGLCLTCLLTLLVAGYLSGTGSHLVGGNELDSEAMALSGWARDGGDLRVPHFLATHAMHALPLAGWLLVACTPRSVARQAIGLAASGYVALVAATFVQALAGRPFLPWL